MKEVTKNERAFTLIELLVVVLIIGILAAVAMPQYQKAVWKSSSRVLQQQVMSLARAQDAYFLANGVYATTFPQLDWEFPLRSSSNNTEQTDDKIRFRIRQVTYQQEEPTIISEGVFLTGPYTGAGFRYVHEKGSNARYQDKTLHCVEPFLNGKFCDNVVGAGYFWNPTDGAVVIPM